jgi:energy-coupling factor transport system ATP-binding protein
MGAGVRFSDVTFAYEGRSEASIVHIDLTIEPGSFVVLTGRSGCGKSTIIKACCGLIPHSYPGTLTGSVQLGGGGIAEMRSWEIARHIGVVFQDPRSQFFTTTVDDEIAFACENLGMSSPEIEERVQQAARLTGVERLRGRPIFDLSSGQKQLVALASVIAAGPSVLLLDEPSANLDLKSTERLGRILEELHRLGHTIIVAEHRLAFLMNRADRLIRLDQGSITHEWSAEAARALPDEELQALGLRRTREPDTLAQQEQQTRAADQGRRLEFSGVTVRAGHAEVLRAFTEAVEQPAGAVIAITGPIGSGKTTLARAVAGLTRVRAGAVAVDGKRLTGRERVRRSFFVMQDTDYQLFSDTVAHELTLANPDLSEGRAAEILAQLGLQGRESDHPLSLSDGQKQRLAIAVAVASGSDVLVFDEPSSGLDSDSMRRVVALLRKLSQDGSLIIVTTHDDELLAELPHHRIRIAPNRDDTAI